MSEINSYKDLLVWQMGVKIVKEAYLITNSFPESEKFGLISQIRRSAVSIPSNIAEGYGREYTRNYSQFLKIARGSLAELETQFVLACELEMVKSSECENIFGMLVEESKMLNSLIKKMNQALAN